MRRTPRALAAAAATFEAGRRPVVDRRHNPNDTDNQAHTGRGRRYRNAGRLDHPCHGTDGTQARGRANPP